LFRRFHDESGPVLVEAISVQVKPAALGLAEVKGKGVELLFCAQPDEAVVTHVEVRLEDIFVFLAGIREDAVSGYDQIGIASVIIRIGDLGLEDQLHAQASSTLLQNLQQLHARDAAEAVAARGQLAALKTNVNIVPV